MRRKVTFMQVEKTKQPLPENGHIFATGIFPAGINARKIY